MFKKAFQLFTKSKLCFIPFLLFFAAAIIYCLFYAVPNAEFHIFELEYREYLLFVEQPFMLLTFILFVLFLVLSYEYFSKARRVGFLESFSATEKAVPFLINQFLVLELLAAAFAIVITVFSFIVPIKSKIADWEYISYLIKLGIMYFFVADTIAVLIGYLISKIKSSIAGYVLIIFTTFMFSPIVCSIADTIGMSSDKIYLNPFVYMFEVFPQAMSNYDADSYGYPLNSHNYMLAVFWLALLIGIVSLSLLKKKETLKKSVVSISLAIVILAGVYVNLPYSEYAYHDEDKYRSTFEPVEYYNPFGIEPENIPFQYNEPSNFNIAEMDIDLKINRQLSAIVTIQVDDTQLSDYKFTLLRGYKVKSIKDGNGNELKYDRYSDYITVYPDNEESIRNGIIFEYSGRNNSFYSNNQGAFLPTGIAYYPINGFRYVYDMRKQDYFVNAFDQPALINLTVDTKKTVYSNLERTADGKNEFSGISDGLTLVSGFYKETEVEGCRFVYVSYGRCDENMINNDIAEEIRNNQQFYDGKTIVWIDRAVGGKRYDYYEASDHVLFNNEMYLYWHESVVDDFDCSNNYLDVFYRFLTFYDENSALYKAYTDITENGADYDKTDINYALAEKIVEYGDDEVYEWLRVHMMAFEDASIDYTIDFIGKKTEFDLQCEQYEKEMGL